MVLEEQGTSDQYKLLCCGGNFYDKAKGKAAVESYRTEISPTFHLMGLKTHK